MPCLLSSISSAHVDLRVVFFYSVASLLVPALETLQLPVLFDPRLALRWCAGQVCRARVRPVVAGAPSATGAGFSAF